MRVFFVLYFEKGHFGPKIALFYGPIYIINIGINAIFKEISKKYEKILEKVCRYENNAYLCIRNQEISSYKTKQRVANRKI